MVKDEAVGGVDAELGFLASDAETTRRYLLATLRRLGRMFCRCGELGKMLWTLGGTTTFVFSTGVGQEVHVDGPVSSPRYLT